MAKTKLTLWVDEALIARAKQFSQRNDTSVSALVSLFLASLDDDRGVATPVASSQPTRSRPFTISWLST